MDDTEIIVRPPLTSLAYKNGDAAEHRFKFTKVFDREANQQHVFSNTMKDNVDRLFNESKNTMLVAYGCSGTGKSHTIYGSDSQPGLIDNIFKYLFELIEGNAKQSNHKYNFIVFLSYLEIYNEKIYDLLTDPSKTNESKVPLKLTVDKQRRPVVSKLNEVSIACYSESKKKIHQGNNNRQCASTAVNHSSSRSHAVITIKLVRMPAGISREVLLQNPEKYLRVSKLSLVDLAGNERVNRSNTTGDRLVEGCNINLSLMTFHRCIDVLKSNQSRSERHSEVIPFRDSKLTTLLQEYLLGNSHTVMVVCASPSGNDYDETINSLKFSAIAKQVTTIQTTAKDTPMVDSAAIAEFENKIATLETQNSTMQKQHQKKIEEFESKISFIENKHVEIQKQNLEFVSNQYNNQLLSNQEQFNVLLDKQVSAKNQIYEDEKRFLAMVIATMKEKYEVNIVKLQDHIKALQSNYENSEFSIEFVETKENKDSNKEKKEYVEQKEKFEKLKSKYEQIKEETEAIQQKLDQNKEKYATLKKENQENKMKLAELERNEKKDQNSITKLNIQLNNYKIEKEQLREEINQLQNLVEKLENQTSTGNDVVSKNEFNETNQRLAEALENEERWRSKANQLQEELATLNDQLNDYKKLIKHQQMEQQSKNGKSPSRTPNPTPSPFKKLITPKKTKKIQQTIPSAVHHTTESSSNVTTTFNATVNPSLTGTGASVLFSNIEVDKKAKSKATAGKNNSQQSVLGSPLASPIMKKQKKEEVDSDEELLSDSDSDGLIELESTEESPAPAKKTIKKPAPAVQPTKKKLLVKTKGSNENVLNVGKKRKSSDISLSDLSSEDCPPLKKAKTTKKPLQVSKAKAKTLKASPKRKTRTVRAKNTAR